MDDCVVCGRDLRRHGNVTGNPLDGYTSTSNLCAQCNRDELRARGLGQLADKDQRDEKLARLIRTTQRPRGVSVTGPST